MSVNAPTPRPVRTAKTILQEAYNELVDREERMQKLEAELAETRNAIKVLRKLLGLKEIKLLSTKPNWVPPKGVEINQSGSVRKPGQLTQDLIECCRTSLEPLTREQLVEQLGVDGRGLSHAINTAKDRGVIIERDGAYGVASSITTTS